MVADLFSAWIKTESIHPYLKAKLIYSAYRKYVLIAGGFYKYGSGKSMDGLENTSKAY